MEIFTRQFDVEWWDSLIPIFLDWKLRFISACMIVNFASFCSSLERVYKILNLDGETRVQENDRIDREKDPVERVTEVQRKRI